MALVAPLQAASVFELEANGTAQNNTLATAMLLPGAFFTANVSPNVFGALPTVSVQGSSGTDDVDFFAFFAPAGTAYFDVDDTATGLDTYLALFNSAGTLLADNDDSFPLDPGSTNASDAFLGSVSLPSDGTYYVAVAAYPNFANATFTGDDFTELFRPDGEFGGFAFGNADTGDTSFAASGPQLGDAYTLHVTIPEPSSGLLAVCSLVCLVNIRRRRHNG
jgi:hypothetical protein